MDFVSHDATMQIQVQITALHEPQRNISHQHEEEGQLQNGQESQKEQISTIEKNKQLEEVMQIFKKISIKETDESIKSTVALFIVSNIIDLVTDDLTKKNQTTPIQDFKSLLDIINGAPNIDKIVSGGKNKNKSKKNKQSNKRKTKRRKSANSKKIKFTKVKTL